MKSGSKLFRGFFSPETAVKGAYSIFLKILVGEASISINNKHRNHLTHDQFCNLVLVAVKENNLFNQR